MATISITPAAFAAIEWSLPAGWKVELRPDGQSGYLVTLPNGVLDRLRTLRGADSGRKAGEFAAI